MLAALLLAVLVGYPDRVEARRARWISAAELGEQVGDLQRDEPPDGDWEPGEHGAGASHLMKLAYTSRHPQTRRNLAVHRRLKERFAVDDAGLRQMDALMWQHRGLPGSVEVLLANLEQIVGARALASKTVAGRRVDDRWGRDGFDGHDEVVERDVREDLVLWPAGRGAPRARPRRRLARAAGQTGAAQTAPGEDQPEPPAWLHPLALAAAAMAGAAALVGLVLSAISPTEVTEIGQMVPDMFICPIGCDVMQDPVVTAGGNTYERELIANWLKAHSTDPLTNEPLRSKRLTPNLALRSAIAAWTEQRRGGGVLS